MASGYDGHALMAVWSRALPLTANCLSPLPVFESHPEHVGKLPVTWGYAVFLPGTAVISTSCNWRITTYIKGARDLRTFK